MSNWITLSQYSGTSGTTVINVTASENINTIGRNIRYKITNNNMAANLTITQESGITYLTAYYYISNISNPVTIVSTCIYISEFRVDDGLWETLVPPSGGNLDYAYTFESTGEHKIDYRINRPETSLQLLSSIRMDNSIVRKIIIPGYYETISRETCDSCTELTDVSLGLGIEVIKSGAFYNCASLNTITLPETITTIETRVFSYCTNLNTIYSYAITAPLINTYTFQNAYSTGTLHYPSGSDYSSWASNQYLSNWTFVADL